MCGISGFTFSEKARLKKMVRCMNHRGPDSSDTYVDEHVSLGHNRLAIIDLSAKGRQPMFDDDDDIGIVFNGEIFNYLELREELRSKGHRFRSETDTEVIIEAYKEWGTECFSRLNGMWALAIYDREKKVLVLSRDRFGIKPLYLAEMSIEGRPSLLFSSEIRGLHEAGVPKAPSAAGINDYFFFRFSLDQTCFENVKKMPAAHYLVYDLKKRTSRMKRFYSLPKRVKSASSKELRELMEDSVRRRLIADVPVGFYLSGGLDSTAIVSLAAKHTEDIGGTIKTFSVGFETTNELPNAKRAAETIGTDHTEIFVPDSDASILPRILQNMEEPIGDPAFLPTYRLAERAKKDVTVVLSGEGADEVFGGYNRYRLLMYGRRLARGIPNPLLNAASRAHPIMARVASMQGLSAHQQHLQAVAVFPNKKPSTSTAALFTGSTVLQRAQSFDVQTVLPNDFFMKQDKMGMAHSIEARVPFMDYRVVEMGLRMPDSAKIGMLSEKIALRRALTPVMPRFARTRKKHGFDVPMDAWFGTGGVLRDDFQRLLDQPKASELFDREEAQRSLQRFSGSSGTHTSRFFTAQQIYTTYLFELWHENHFGDRR